MIDALKHRGDVTARQIAYELQVYDVWFSSEEIAYFIDALENTSELYPDMTISVIILCLN